MELPPPFDHVAYMTVRHYNHRARMLGYFSASFADVDGVLEINDSERRIMADNLYFEFPSLQDLTTSQVANAL